MRKTIISLALAAALCAPATASFASPTTELTPDQELIKLTELNPGVTEAEMKAELQEYAAEEGTSYEETLHAAYTDAQGSADDVAEDAAESEAAEGKVSPQSSGGGSVKLPQTKVGGDVWYSPVRTAGIKHGHVGIYYGGKTIVEAPGPGKKSHSAPASSTSTKKKSKLMYVKTSEANRKKAGKYAYNNLRGKKYNLNFAANKTDKSAKKLNCSQLVWRSYKKSVKIDLDSNGGPGVYPANIRDSNKTVTWKTL
jgi:uncharacterized protein YycO